MDQAAIHYRIRPADLGAHLFAVTCTVADPDPNGQQFSLPTWIPGSYLIREFARHIVDIAAHAEAPVAIQKIDKSTWACAPCRGPLTMQYQVYAWDLSVRGAHLDTSHGFFNGTSVFLQAHGQHGPCSVDIEAPVTNEARDWRVATALARDGAPAHGFGRYRAESYDELVDHPVEMGAFALATFDACGVPHEFALTGRQRADLARVMRDLQRLCETQIRFFGEPAPMGRYVFLVTAVGEGYGGLEHRASTSLICRRDSLPRSDERETSEAYREFLGLCSHEYFHTWNVKRIKPQAFIDYDLAHENYTRQLWAFEGITSYYDDLILLRSGLIDAKSYLELLGRSITRLLRTPARLAQSVAESSFDAWIKFYRQDENTPNAVVSYYVKGALIALALDLILRRNTQGRMSLDDVMRALWARYGKTGQGVPEGGVERVAEAVSGLDLKPFFEASVYGTEELPLAALLAQFGIAMELRPAESSADKGGKPSSRSREELSRRVTLGVGLGEGQEARIAHVLNGSAAHLAGLAAGDVILAIEGIKATRANLDKLLEGRAPGSTLRVHAFRRDELSEFSAVLQSVPSDTCALTLNEQADEAAIAARRAWLGI